MTSSCFFSDPSVPSDSNVPGMSSPVITLQSIWEQHRVGIVFIASVFGAMLIIFTVLMLIKLCENRRRRKYLQKQPVERDAAMWHYQRLHDSKCPGGPPEVDGNVDSVFVLPHGNDAILCGGRTILRTSAQPASAAERQSLTGGVLCLVAKLSDVIGANVTKTKQSADQDAIVSKLAYDNVVVVGGGDDLQQVTTTRGDDCKTPDADLTSASG